MREPVRLILLTLLSAIPAMQLVNPVQAESGGSYDGEWQAKVNCTESIYKRPPLAYSVRVEIKNDRVDKIFKNNEGAVTNTSYWSGLISNSELTIDIKGSNTNNENWFYKLTGPTTNQNSIALYGSFLDARGNVTRTCTIDMNILKSYIDNQSAAATQRQSDKLVETDARASKQELENKGQGSGNAIAADSQAQLELRIRQESQAAIITEREAKNRAEQEVADLKRELAGKERALAAVPPPANQAQLELRIRQESQAAIITEREAKNRAEQEVMRLTQALATQKEAAALAKGSLQVEQTQQMKRTPAADYANSEDVADFFGTMLFYAAIFAILIYVYVPKHNFFAFNSKVRNAEISNSRQKTSTARARQLLITFMESKTHFKVFNLSILNWHLLVFALIAFLLLKKNTGIEIVGQKTALQAHTQIMESNLTEIKDCADCPIVITLPSGNFFMGTPTLPDGLSKPEKFSTFQAARQEETPQHEVKIKSFAIGKFEITQEQWVKIMGDFPSSYVSERGAQLPITNVSWYEAKKFTQKLSQRTGKKYRLPTEAEWEYAARASTNTMFPFEGGDSAISDYEWSRLNTIPQALGIKTRPVGTKQPNKFGLYDMLGNASEWTEDCFQKDYKNTPKDGSAAGEEQDPARVKPPMDGICWKVIRGGSAVSDISEMRPAYRGRSIPPDTDDNFTGFRVVREITR